MTGLDDQIQVHHRSPELERDPAQVEAELAGRRHAEIRLLLVAILIVSIVGAIFLAWDALD
jgi:hypothetical protein